MGELATSIAHEVKQPVFAILTDAETATEMLDNKNPDLDQVQSALRVITAGGRRVTEIVDRIRSLVRMDEKPPRWVDANELVKSVVGFLEADLRQRNIILSLQLTATLPSILGNEIQLQQVILNLIINGAQAMDQTDVASRVMSVTTRRQHDSVELTVCDCGAGMDASTIERIFEPFFTTKNGGIGMGLTISRTIIRTHGGEIWATPNADRGATFHVRLPIDGTSLGCL
jgi:signal transduction histidine kinase